MPKLHQYQSRAAGLLPILPLLTWFQPLSQPVRTLPRCEAALATSGPVYVGQPLAPAETISVDKWYQPLSEPVRRIAPLPVAAVPAFSIDAAALTRPEVTTVDRWFQALSEPRRTVGFSPAALVASGAVGSLAPIVTVAETVTLDKWYAQWIDPRQRPFNLAPFVASGHSGPTALVAVLPALELTLSTVQVTPGMISSASGLNQFVFASITSQQRLTFSSLRIID